MNVQRVRIVMVPAQSCAVLVLSEGVFCRPDARVLDVLRAVRAWFKVWGARPARSSGAST